MWLYVDYEPAAAFGLRPSNTTSNGGKSLLCPTPYAVKMALLDRLIRAQGLEMGKAWFPQIRDLMIYMRLPQAVAVNRTFQKVLRGWDTKTGEWTQTIVQREYCFHAGMLTLALYVDEEETAQRLTSFFSAVNYFGRRGSFMQFVGYTISEAAPDNLPGFVNASRSASPRVGMGFLQRMDDMQPQAVFDDVSIMNPRANGGRTSYTVIFPYQLAFHGFNHTVYALERQTR